MGQLRERVKNEVQRYHKKRLGRQMDRQPWPPSHSNTQMLVEEKDSLDGAS